MTISDMHRGVLASLSLLIGLVTAVPTFAQDSAVESARGRVLIVLDGQASVQAMEIPTAFSYYGDSYSTGRGFVRITGRARLISLMSDVAESVEVTATVFSGGARRDAVGRTTTAAPRAVVSGTMTFAPRGGIQPGTPYDVDINIRVNESSWEAQSDVRGGSTINVEATRAMFGRGRGRLVAPTADPGLPLLVTTRPAPLTLEDVAVHVDALDQTPPARSTRATGRVSFRITNRSTRSVRAVSVGFCAGAGACADQEVPLPRPLAPGGSTAVRVEVDAILPLAMTAASTVSYYARPLWAGDAPRIATQSLDLHETRAARSPVVASLPAGTRVFYLEGSRGWTRVRSPRGELGWVPDASLTLPTDRTTATPPGSRTHTAVVESSEGLPSVHVGDTCRMRVMPPDTDPRCAAEMACGQTVLYQGYFPCDLSDEGTAVRASDPHVSSIDGDARFLLDTSTASFEISDESTRERPAFRVVARLHEGE